MRVQRFDQRDLDVRPDRRYNDDTVLDDITVAVADRCVTGLLGHNGAGKSTFMRIVTGQEFATSGTVRVFGAEPLENDDVLRRIVFVREDQSFPDVRVRQAVQAASWFYRIGTTNSRRRCSTIFDCRWGGR